eukprot:TRINITY_DN3383_c0_g1_i2.p1 TRINITY_DN3383_c0_g1~~TRINITY_DN3383_c0_g1_i2.p1  ORF type:complete len:695 (-),score=96.94 TRINITY_DN3383_c0_g1_i2:244-2328(-)
MFKSSGINAEYGGTDLTITGLNFDTNTVVQIDGVNITNINLDGCLTNCTKMTLTAPNITTNLPRYVTVSVFRVDGGFTSCPSLFRGGPTFTRSDLGYLSCPNPSGSLYYATSCIRPGEYGTGECKPCPEGATCPGGNRVYPIPGWWSENTTVAPIHCPVEGACQGFKVVTTCELYSENDYCDKCLPCYASNNRTSRCSDCDTDCYMLQPSKVCVSCLTGTVSPAAMIVVALIFFSIITFGIIVLDDNYLDNGVGLLLALQQLVQIGGATATDLSRSVQDFFNLASLILFDYTFVEPGCNVAYVTFPEVYGGTLIVLLAFAVVFTLGAAFRSWLLLRKHKGVNQSGITRTFTLMSVMTAKQQSAGFLVRFLISLIIGPLQQAKTPDNKVEKDDTEELDIPSNNSSTRKRRSRATVHVHFLDDWKEAFKRRAIRSLLILFTITYYIITYRTFQALNCVQDPSTPLWTRLKVELHLRCFHDEHRQIAPVAFIVLILDTIGFPLLCCYLIYKATKAGIDIPLYRDSFGYLYRGLRKKGVWFRLTPFIFNITVAFEVTFRDNQLGMTYVFINLMLFLLNTGMVIYAWPFLNKFLNIIFIGAGLARVVYLLALLGAVGHNYSRNMKIAYWVIVALGIFVFIILNGGYRIYQNYKKSQNKDKPISKDDIPLSDIELHIPETATISAVESPSLEHKPSVPNE